MSSAPLFQLRNLRYSYGPHRALQDITLGVQPGSRIALLGANGSGKSTLLRLLNWLYTPESGSIHYKGTQIDEERLQDERFVMEFRRSVALLFQDPDVQLFNPTVFDEVAFGPLQLGWPNEQIRTKVEQILAYLNISPLRDRAPYRLSGGEKKRVALASILVLQPDVLLLDEPTAALDPRSQGQFVHLLQGLDKGRTVITATHDLDIVEDVADYCYVLENGAVIANGTPAEILGDTSLLQRANLIYAHQHTHGSGEPHFHPHIHHEDG